MAHQRVQQQRASEHNEDWPVPPEWEGKRMLINGNKKKKQNTQKTSFLMKFIYSLE